MPVTDTNSFDARQKLAVGEKTYTYYSIPAAEKAGLADAASRPRSNKLKTPLACPSP